MALHTKKEFARMCGVTTSALAVYLQRGKILVSGDMIDDSIAQNADFMSQKRLNQSMAGELSGGSQADPDVDGTTLNSLTRKKLLTEIDKLGKESAVLDHRIEKRNAEVIPTQLVRIIFKSHGNSLHRSFEQSIDEIIAMFSKSRPLSAAEEIDIRATLTTALDHAVKKSSAMLNRQVENIISEFSQKRDNGERGEAAIPDA